MGGTFNLLCWEDSRIRGLGFVFQGKVPRLFCWSTAMHKIFHTVLLPLLFWYLLSFLGAGSIQLPNAG